MHHVTGVHAIRIAYAINFEIIIIDLLVNYCSYAYTCRTCFGLVCLDVEHVCSQAQVHNINYSNKNKKAQLSLTNPRDACEKFARFT